MLSKVIENTDHMWTEEHTIIDNHLLELLFNDWKNEFVRIIDIRIDNFTKYPHLYKQAPSRSVRSLKKKVEKLHRKYVFAPADKAANNVIII